MYQRTHEFLDLFEYLDALGDDRPPLGAMLAKLGIDAYKMYHIVSATGRSSVALGNPDVAVEAVNDLFKMGITIGYKYAISRQMEKTFGIEDETKGDATK